MKDLRVSASATVAATPEACTALLAAVDGYPSWYPDVIREAEVLERDRGGTPVRARATVHLALGPIVHDLELLLTVDVEPGRHVTLTLVTDHPSDTDAFKLSWTVDPGPPTRLELELSARVDVPRFLPVGSLGGPLAQGFVDAASRALAGSSPNASATSS
jgi:hypothetical protein